MRQSTGVVPHGAAHGQVLGGLRFVEVRETRDSLVTDPDGQQFDIGLEVLAATSEGPLEYRVYAKGQTPEENWVAAGAEGEQLRAVLRSPKIGYGPPGSVYHLIVEARRAADGSVQKYPFSFRLKQQVKRAGSEIPRDP